MERSRKRTMPLVPEPFKTFTVSRQSVFFRSDPMAKRWARFCPNLNIPQYREPLSEEKKTELDQRATKLNKTAIRNQIGKFSEFGWEVCAWHDVFGLIMDDEGLRMDKRPYEYVETEDGEQGTVKLRIPDATLGLVAYDDYDLKRGYVCEVPECEEDHSSKQPDNRLSQDRLKAMMHNHECALVVDGVWGKTDLIFPFAVYEAKKRASSYEAAENQIYHACKTYLAMLDDLARNPDEVDKYQTEDSDKYQLFAFTSCGSYWEVYVAWKFLDNCLVETIWEGDVKEFSRAYDLICIIDQIHEYAARDHRGFVMKHLEAWHARHERTQKEKYPFFHEPFTASETPEEMELSDSNETDSELDSCSGDPDSSGDSHDFSDLMEKLVSNWGTPKWFDLKCQSNMTRQDKARQTRERNKKLREATRQQETENMSPVKKRGRGRPPKSQVRKDEAPKRRRGRPPKRSSAFTEEAKTAPRVTRRSTRTRTTTAK